MQETPCIIVRHYKDDTWEVLLHHSIPCPPHIIVAFFLEWDTGTMVDLYKSLDPTPSHSL